MSSNTEITAKIT